MWQLRDAFTLLVGISRFALQLMLDFVTMPADWPTRPSDLTPAVMSKLLHKTIVQVTPDEAYSNRKVEDVGAGGTGTSRAWLILVDTDGTMDHVFVKLPSTSITERMFLTIFGVYENELSFYRSIASLNQFPDGIFAKPYCVESFGNRFVLVLENVAYRGNVVFPGILAPYPQSRAETVMRSLALFHAANWGAPPKGCWTDQWSSGTTIPPGTPSDATRPPALRLIFETTLKQVIKRYGMPKELQDIYTLYIHNEPLVRKYYSEGPLTMVWGDCHYGNMFFYDKNGIPSLGLYDAQCVAAEHGMRDVCYHLVSGFDADALPDREKGFVKLYCDTLNEELRKQGKTPLEYEDAWFQYRVQVLYVVLAFVTSAGASKLMKEAVARPVLDRIYRAAHRLDSGNALKQVLTRNKVE